MGIHLTRIRRLVEEGYAVEDVESEDGVIEATLRRGGAVVRIRLSREDAEELLYGGPPVWPRR